MSVDPQELEKFTGKKATIHVSQEDGSLQELEGRIVKASATGVFFKEKGKSNGEIYMPGQIEEITVEAEAPKKLRQSKVKPVNVENVRQHLVSKHAMPLSIANQRSDEEALKIHESIDHSDLGHKHVAEGEDKDDSEPEGNEE